MNRAPSERTIVLLVAAVQFVNILDFMMVMPMGPDFADALHIPTSQLGLIGGSYTAAACVAGIAGSFFLDRFDRRSALGIAMLGLVVGTLLGGLATDLPTLLAARVVAGAFGGPATSLATSIVSDTVPSERRGKAMGIVMSAFAAASVLGVPAGLKLARHGGWRMPFLAVGALGFLIAALAVFLLPSMRAHLDRKDAQAISIRSLMSRPVVLYSYAMSFTAMMGMFVLVPNISGYLQRNLGYPRQDIETLYLLGGLMSFLLLQVAGRLVDRFGSTPVATLGTAAVLFALYAGFMNTPPLLPVMVVFVGFMASTGLRNVAFNTLTSRIPRPEERARFMSLQSAVQHAASAVGAVLSSKILSEDPNGRLLHMNDVCHISIAMMLALPVLMLLVERRVNMEARGTANLAQAH